MLSFHVIIHNEIVVCLMQAHNKVNSRWQKARNTFNCNFQISNVKCHKITEKFLLRVSLAAERSKKQE